MFSKKEKKKICANCMLYDRKQRHCKVVVLHEGERFNLPTSPQDECFFLESFTATTENGEKDVFKVQADVVKMWVEDPITGEKSEKGVVKIEVPKSL